jgi:hypothetical protein
VKKHIPLYPVGSVILRKPIRMGGFVPIGIFNFDPEPFVINRVEGKLQGKYELSSLVTGELEIRWYKPYEIRVVPKPMYEDLFYSPILFNYLRNKFDDAVVENFITNIVPSLMSLF